MREAPKPSQHTVYNVHEAAFWRLRHLPAGSVITFRDPEAPVHADAPVVALLVLATESLATGMWATVKVLGSEQTAEKKKAEKYFKDGKHRVHICYVDKE